jgi:hypothetical protein
MQDADNCLLARLKAEGNELLLLQQTETDLLVDEKQELHKLLGQHGYFFLRSGTQGELFATNNVVQVLFLGHDTSPAQCGVIQQGSSSAGASGNSSGGGGEGAMSQAPKGGMSGSGTTAQPVVAQHDSSATACCVHKLCTPQQGVPPINVAPSAVHCEFFLDPQQRTGNDSELWFKGTSSCVTANVVATAHVCSRSAGDDGKVC